MKKRSSHRIHALIAALLGVVGVLSCWISPKAGVFETSSSSAFEAPNSRRNSVAASLIVNELPPLAKVKVGSSVSKFERGLSFSAHESLKTTALPPINSILDGESSEPPIEQRPSKSRATPETHLNITAIALAQEKSPEPVAEISAPLASLIPSTSDSLFRPLPAFAAETKATAVQVQATAWQRDVEPANDGEPSVFDSESQPTETTKASSSAAESNFGDRIAMATQTDEKPEFRKFGSRVNVVEKEKNSDEDDDDSLAPKQPTVLSASDRWKLAGQPGAGDRYKDDTPLLDSCSTYIKGAHGNFSPTPTMQEAPYDPMGQMNVYQGKKLYSNQRPLLELGRPWYQLGPISEGSSILGAHNHVNWQYLLFGDFRTGIASNRQNGNTSTLVATQLNLVHHLKLTSTERIVAGMSPFGAAQNTRYEFDNDRFVFEGDADFDFGFIEADLGAIAGGIMGETLPFDLPVAVGVMPLVFQNGVWFEDAILGAAVTIPAKSSPRFDISNMDITFFAGYDKLDSPAFEGDDSAARIVGMAAFIEALNGYFEVDYAFLDDRSGLDRSYHNFAFAYSRRFGRFLSNSTRIIVNAGQESVAQDNTADGVLLISENSLITGSPSTVVPYLNMWAGFDRPQSAARAGIAGGVLRNTGILFESDNLTGYPTLDASGNDTFGMALGLNLLADEFAQQFIVEAAMLGVMGDRSQRIAQGDQYGIAARYQLPLSNSVIFRADAMVGFLRGDDDINGVRMEMRKKF